MAAESVVFIIVFALVLLAIAFGVMTLTAKFRTQQRVDDAVEEQAHAQRQTPEAKQRATRAEIVDVKAATLGGIEADEAAGRTPPMRGHHVREFRRRVRRQIEAHRVEEENTAAKGSSPHGV